MTNLPTDVNSRVIQTLTTVTHQSGTMSIGAALKLAIPDNSQVIHVASVLQENNYLTI